MVSNVGSSVAEPICLRFAAASGVQVALRIFCFICPEPQNRPQVKVILFTQNTNRNTLTKICKQLFIYSVCYNRSSVETEQPYPSALTPLKQRPAPANCKAESVFRIQIRINTGKKRINWSYMKCKICRRQKFTIQRVN